jgi:predicted CxxxxCH...CXXCH cytochrome family protein
MPRHALASPHLARALALAALAAGLACGTARGPLESEGGRAVAVCATCHGFPPGSTELAADPFAPAQRIEVRGALRPTEVTHLVHTGWRLDPAGGALVPSALGKRLACLECHENVQSVDDPDHIWRDPQTRRDPVPPPAEVRFDDPGALARRGEARAAGPAFDPATQNCSNVYCHGGGLEGSAGVAQPVRWTGGPAGQAGCGSCHGIPPPNHEPGLSITRCAVCHAPAIDATGVLNPSLHVNGTVDVAAGIATSCATCHGDRSAGVRPGDPRSAPPTDARGRAAGDPAATGIGAHQQHLRAGRLGVAVACRDCHVVPATLFAPGHVNNVTEVRLGGRAAQGGLSPSYSTATQTCSNVYCHGSFPFSKAGGAPPAPTWNGGSAAVACGFCHDLPPPPPAHRPVNVATQGCGTADPAFPTLACHGTGYTPTTVDPKLHIDGRVCPPFCTPATP